MLGFHRDRIFGGLLFNRKKIISEADRKMEAFDVRPRDPLLTTANFSGGNQQKLVLAREIDHQPRIMLVGQPTRGVDIGAIEFIHRRIVDERDSGKAVFLVSVELDEIFSLSDRIIVLCAGRVTGERRPEQTNPQDLGLLMAGVAERAA
jgi:simple sugar transport system ATP-binding protein